MRTKQIVLRFDVECDDELSRRDVATVILDVVESELAEGEIVGVRLKTLRSLMVDGGDYTDPTLA